MKKYCAAILASTLVFCMTGNAATMTKPPIMVGVEYHIKSASVPVTAWANVVNAIQTATHQTVQIKEYENHQKMVQDLSSGKLAMGYLKSVTGSEATSKNKDIKLLASAVTKDPMTGKSSMTYDAQILVAKNSMITDMAGLQNKTFAYYSPRSISNYVSPKDTLAAQKITVHWEKFPTEAAAFNAVLHHRADAISAWSYLVSTNPNKSQFKTISTTDGLKNPSIYVNTTIVSKAEQRMLTTALAHVKGPYDIVGFRG